MGTDVLTTRVKARGLSFTAGMLGSWEWRQTLFLDRGEGCVSPEVQPSRPLLEGYFYMYLELWGGS